MYNRPGTPLSEGSDTRSTPLLPLSFPCQPGTVWTPGLCSSVLRGGCARSQHEYTAAGWWLSPVPACPHPIPPGVTSNPANMNGVSLRGQALKEGRSLRSSLGTGLLSRSSLSYTALSRTLFPGEILLLFLHHIFTKPPRFYPLHVGQEQTPTCVSVWLTNPLPVCYIKV